MRDRITVGFAVDSNGRGIAYAQIAAANQLVRASFSIRRNCPERAPAYAALASVLRALIERGYDRLDISIDDPALHDEMQRKKDVPRALNLAYVQLGCLLNRLRGVTFGCPAGAELTQRAQTELVTPAAA
ncbi:MAG: hypothetical protein JO165_13685 [Candidatus Eremiobacteraeota bacterium]|nr:hypothetical protein [Candidatus Eremiobacteraeota bacterium]